MQNLENKDILQLIQAEKVDFRRSKSISINIPSETKNSSFPESKVSVFVFFNQISDFRRKWTMHK